MAGTIQVDFLQPSSNAGLYIVSPAGATFATINSAGIFSNTGVQMVTNTGVLGNIASTQITTNTIFSGTGAITLPAGTTGQQPTGVSGMLRFNTTISQFEGYTGSAWGSIGGGATGGGSDQVFNQNGQSVTTNYTIPTGKNASSVGPISLNSGITVTISSGSRWVVL